MMLPVRTCRATGLVPKIWVRHSPLASQDCWTCNGGGAMHPRCLLYVQGFCFNGQKHHQDFYTRGKQTSWLFWLHNHVLFGQYRHSIVLIGKNHISIVLISQYHYSMVLISHWIPTLTSLFIFMDSLAMAMIGHKHHGSLWLVIKI